MCCLKRRRRVYYRDKDWRVPRHLSIPIPSQYPSQIVFPGPDYTSLPTFQTTTTPAYTPVQPNYPPIMAASSQSLPMLLAPAAIVSSSALTHPFALGQPPAPMQPATMWQQHSMMQQPPFGMAQPPGMFQPPSMVQPSTMMQPYTTTQPFPMAAMVQAPNYYGSYPAYNTFMPPRF